MQKEQIRAELERDPFVPLRLHLRSGKTFDVPFREVAHMVAGGVLVLIGLKPGTHTAERYDRFAYDEIVRIELTTGRGRRRKAS